MGKKHLNFSGQNRVTKKLLTLTIKKRIFTQIGGARGIQTLGGTGRNPTAPSQVAPSVSRPAGCFSQSYCLLADAFCVSARHGLDPLPLRSVFLMLFS